MDGGQAYSKATKICVIYVVEKQPGNFYVDFVNRRENIEQSA